MKHIITVDKPSKLRVAWDQAKDYPVVVHKDWTAKRTRSRQATERRRRHTLKHHPLYWSAKKHGDYIAAQEIVDDLVSDEALMRILKYIGDKSPIIVAPSLAKQDPSNVIPYSFAHYLAYELGLQVSSDILQRDTAHRTGRGGFYRLAFDPEFYGKVIEGEDYMIVDDVSTMGGTLASMRSFIEQNGGNVICMSVLADSNMKSRVNGSEIVTDFNLNASPERLKELEHKHGKKLSEFWERSKGYGLNCLTNREVDFLQFFPRFHNIKGAMIDEQNLEREKLKTLRAIDPRKTL